MKNDSFIGKGWFFPPQFNSPSSGPDMVTEEEEIRQAIWIIISTAIGERGLHPRFGSGLSSYTFEAGNLSIISDLKEELKITLLLEETRIDVENIDIAYIDVVSGHLSIDIIYVIRETNTRYNLVFPFYVNEFS